jgi:hypothetical protein
MVVQHAIDSAKLAGKIIALRSPIVTTGISSLGVEVMSSIRKLITAAGKGPLIFASFSVGSTLSSPQI